MTWGGFAGSQEPGCALICEAGCLGPPGAHGVLRNSSQGSARWACPCWPRSRLPVVGSAQGTLCTSPPLLQALPAGLGLQLSDRMLAPLGPWVSMPGRCGAGLGVRRGRDPPAGIAAPWGQAPGGTVRDSGLYLSCARSPSHLRSKVTRTANGPFIPGRLFFLHKLEKLFLKM